MKKTIMLMFVSLLVIASISAVSATSGAVWTTTAACDTPQDANHYGVGEDVYIHGNSFAPETYDWNIFAVPEKDPAVASGTYNVVSTGEFCFYAYTIQPGDEGVYKAYVDNKSDNYSIKGSNVVPEFGTYVGALTILSAIGVFFFIRRN